jgi:Flagellar protein FliT
MDTVRRQQLAEIIRLSREMLETARQLEWGTVADLEARRKPLVLDCFREPAPKQDAAEVAAVVREILNLDQQVAELGKQCQTVLGSEIHTHNRGHAATSAYLSHTD